MTLIYIASQAATAAAATLYVAHRAGLQPAPTDFDL